MLLCYLILIFNIKWVENVNKFMKRENGLCRWFLFFNIHINFVISRWYIKNFCGTQLFYLNLFCTFQFYIILVVNFLLTIAKIAKWYNFLIQFSPFLYTNVITRITGSEYQRIMDIEEWKELLFKNNLLSSPNQKIYIIIYYHYL